MSPKFLFFTVCNLGLKQKSKLKNQNIYFQRGTRGVVKNKGKYKNFKCFEFCRIPVESFKISKIGLIIQNVTVMYIVEID